MEWSCQSVAKRRWGSELVYLIQMVSCKGNNHSACNLGLVIQVLQGYIHRRKKYRAMVLQQEKNTSLSTTPDTMMGHTQRLESNLNGGSCSVEGTNIILEPPHT